MTCHEFVVALSVTAGPTPQLAAHAQSCPQCHGLWRAEMLLRGAQRVVAAPAPSPALQRLFVQHSFVQNQGSTRITHPLQRILAVFAAVSASVAFALFCVPRADLNVAATALLVLPFAVFALVSIAGLQLYAYRGRSGLGVPPWLRWAFAAVVVALFEGVVGLEVATAAPWHAALGAGRVPAARDCLLLGLCVASLVAVVAFAVSRRTVLVGAASSGALAGSIAGLAAVMFLHVHCAAADARHLSIVHALPLLCAIAVGALVGRRVLAV